MCERRAVILAGGHGTRLRPYTVVLPKPLMPIGDYPILEVIVRQLAKQGFERLTLAVSHQAHLIQAFFQDGGRWGLKIDYSLEEESLSTIGPLALIPDLPDDFLLMNGDVLTDLCMSDLLERHVDRQSLFTIASSTREQMTDYGVLHVDESSRLIGFEEKPKSQYLVSMGVYAVSRRVLEFVPVGRPYGFDNLMLDLLRAGKCVDVIRHPGYWLDIGRPDDYMKAIDDFPDRQEELLR